MKKLQIYFYLLIGLLVSSCRSEQQREITEDEVGIVGMIEGARTEAIEEDGLPSIQVLNEEGQEILDVVDLYGINAFPKSLLLDRDGIILKRKIGAPGTDLDEKLAEVFLEVSSD